MKRTSRTGQLRSTSAMRPNNFYVYPAVGLATYVARPRLITDECFIAAAQATADQVDSELRAKGSGARCPSVEATAPNRY